MSSKQLTLSTVRVSVQPRQNRLRVEKEAPHILNLVDRYEGAHKVSHSCCIFWHKELHLILLSFGIKNGLEVFPLWTTAVVSNLSGHHE